MALGSSGTILYVAKISYQSDKWFGNCYGGPKFYTDTDTGARTRTRTHARTHANTHTHTQRDTHIHRGLFYVLFFCENAETRLKSCQIYKSTSIK